MVASCASQNRISAAPRRILFCVAGLLFQAARAQHNLVFRNEDIAPIRLAKRFNSPLCRNFYAETVRPEPLEVWESPKGRSTTWHCHGAIMDVCPQEKLAYLINFKAGSSTTRKMLRDSFGCSESDWGWTENPDGNGFTLSYLLNDTITENFFFFSVVRDPLERFISSYKESLYLHPELRNTSITEFLEMYKLGNVNGHTSTQACLLGGTDAYGRQVPMHFIGKLERLYEDFDLLFEYLGMPVPGEYLTMRAAENMPLKAGISTELTIAQIQELCEHLMQDYVCFDYELPDMCRY